MGHESGSDYYAVRMCSPRTWACGKTCRPNGNQSWQLWKVARKLQRTNGRRMTMTTRMTRMTRMKVQSAKLVFLTTPRSPSFVLQSFFLARMPRRRGRLCFILRRVLQSRRKILDAHGGFLPIWCQPTIKTLLLVPSIALDTRPSAIRMGRNNYHTSPDLYLAPAMLLCSTVSLCLRTWWHGPL